MQDQEKTSSKVAIQRHLIQLVQGYPCIWNDADQGHSNKHLRSQAFTEIHVQLQDQFGSDAVGLVEDVKKQWKQLRDYWGREFVKATKYNSDSQPHQKYLSPWSLYKELLFLSINKKAN